MRGTYKSEHAPIKGGAMHYSVGRVTRCGVDLTSRDGKPRFTKRFGFERLGYVAPVNITHDLRAVTCTRCLRKLIAHTISVRDRAFDEVARADTELDRLRAQMLVRSKVAA